MQFSTKTLSVDRLKTGCVIVPVVAGQALAGDPRTLDRALGGRLSTAIARGDLDRKSTRLNSSH